MAATIQLRTGLVASCTSDSWSASRSVGATKLRLVFVESVERFVNSGEFGGRRAGNDPEKMNFGELKAGAVGILVSAVIVGISSWFGVNGAVTGQDVLVELVVVLDFHLHPNVPCCDMQQLQEDYLAWMRRSYRLRQGKRQA